MAKDARGYRCSWLLAATVTLVLTVLSSYAPPVSAAAGRKPGTFSVGLEGAATYSIPIFVPPGPNGMQPSVALVYSSNGGIGYVGKGWSLAAGLSSISRCATTVAADGVAANTEGGPWDNYCLDGNRLRYQSGTWGYDGSVFLTELSNFSKVTVTGNQSISPYGVVGPQSWTVHRKDGTIWTYGGTADARFAYPSGPFGTWLLNMIEDRAGNRIAFTYKTPDSATSGTTHPTKIEWTRTYAGSSSYL